MRETIEARLGSIVTDPDKREAVVNVAIRTVEEGFSGPIAHPDHLRQYEEIQPGAADRIITMAEKAQDHRIFMQQTALTGALSDERWGMVLGSSILVGMIVAAFVAGTHYNNPTLAGIFIGGAVLNVIGLYLQRKKPEKM